MVFFLQSFGLLFLFLEEIARARFHTLGRFGIENRGLIDDYLGERYADIVGVEKQFEFPVHIALHLEDILFLALCDEQKIHARSTERGHSLVIA